MEHLYTPSNSSYAYQKFYEATHSLDSEDLFIDRLAKAFGNLNTLREDDFPNEDKLRERFSALMPKLEILAVPREKPLSIEDIEDLSRAKEEAGDLAQEILDIFASLARRSSTENVR